MILLILTLIFAAYIVLDLRACNRRHAERKAAVLRRLSEVL